MSKIVPTEIVANCDCGVGLRNNKDWWVCPECLTEAVLEG